MWMGVIFAFSAQQSLPGFGNSTFDLLLKKGGHAVGYGVLALLAARALARGRSLRVRQVAWALLIAAVYAATDEYHQSFVPGRTPSGIDWGIDLAGSIVAIAWRWAGRRRLP
jgi:VanZ family protein